jgi:hypothetical protein
MGTCPKCNGEKPDGSSYCRECHRAYSKEHYKRNKRQYNQRRCKNAKARREQHRKRINDIKNNQPCADCGVSYPHYVMEFDHLRDKVANISDMPGKFRWSEIENEIDKCELVCANCHRKRTHRLLPAVG